MNSETFMANKAIQFLRKSALTALLATLLLALSPTGAMAQRGGHSGGGGGYRGGQSYRGGGYAGPRGSYGGGGRYYSAPGYRGGYRGGGYYRGGRYYGGVYIAPYAYGYYPPAYPYAAPACGYYDAWGYWRVYPGCYADQYYGY
jgi:hypothetical protein